MYKISKPKFVLIYKLSNVLNTHTYIYVYVMNIYTYIY